MGHGLEERAPSALRPPGPGRHGAQTPPLPRQEGNDLVRFPQARGPENYGFRFAERHPNRHPHHAEKPMKLAQPARRREAEFSASPAKADTPAERFVLGGEASPSLAEPCFRCRSRFDQIHRRLEFQNSCRGPAGAPSGSAFIRLGPGRAPPKGRRIEVEKSNFLGGGRFASPTN